MSRNTGIIILAILIGLGLTGCWVQEWAQNRAQHAARLQVTATPTPIPTSEPPYEPPKIFAPAAGAVIDGDFQIGSPARAWSVHIVIFNDEDYRQEVILGVGAYFSAWMNEQYTPAPPMPLAPGIYHWYAYACRETAVGGCGPRSQTRTFTISAS